MTTRFTAQGLLSVVSLHHRLPAFVTTECTLIGPSVLKPAKKVKTGAVQVFSFFSLLEVNRTDYNLFFSSHSLFAFPFFFLTISCLAEP